MDMEGFFSSFSLRRCLSGESMNSISTSSEEDLSELGKALLKDRAAKLGDVFLLVKKVQHEKEEYLDGAIDSIATLDASWREGKCDLGPDEFDKERLLTLSVQLHLLTDVSIMRTTSAQIAGCWIDNAASQGQGINRAFVDEAIQCQRGLAKAKKTMETKSTFQEKNLLDRLIRAYAPAHPSKKEGTFWCPVSNSFQPRQLVAAAHVINCNVGEKTAQALFGDETEHIWSTKNGLIIRKEYEELLDTAKAVILPASDNPDENNFVFYLLTDDLGPRRADVWGEELHGRTLSFRTSFRPSRRYLYFKCVVSLLRRRRANAQACTLEIPGSQPVKALWALSGSGSNRAVLYTFSRRLGCLSEDEANRFWGVQRPPVLLSVQEGDRAATLAILSASAVAAEDAEKPLKRDARDSTFSDSDDEE